MPGEETVPAPGIRVKDYRMAFFTYAPGAGTLLDYVPGEGTVPAPGIKVKKLRHFFYLKEHFLCQVPEQFWHLLTYVLRMCQVLEQLELGFAVG